MVSRAKPHREDRPLTVSELEETAFLTPRQVAATLGISTTTVLALDREGILQRVALPVRGRNSTVRYTGPSLAALLRRGINPHLNPTSDRTV